MRPRGALSAWLSSRFHSEGGTMGHPVPLLSLFIEPHHPGPPSTEHPSETEKAELFNVPSRRLLKWASA